MAIAIYLINIYVCFFVHSKMSGTFGKYVLEYVCINKSQMQKEVKIYSEC